VQNIFFVCTLCCVGIPINFQIKSIDKKMPRDEGTKIADPSNVEFWIQKATEMNTELASVFELPYPLTGVDAAAANDATPKTSVRFRSKGEIGTLLAQFFSFVFLIEQITILDCST
jgi:hypothetical protein